MCLFLHLLGGKYESPQHKAQTEIGARDESELREVYLAVHQRAAKIGVADGDLLL